MRYHNITKDDMLNGDGLRVVLWVAGCESTPRTRGAGGPYDRGSLPGLQTIDRRRGPCPPVK